MPYVFIGLGSIFAIFVAVVLIRTLTFKPKALPTASDEEITFDKEKAVADLQALVKCKTISRMNHEGEEDEEFEALVALLPDMYPHVYEKCEFTRFPDRALLYKWEGKNHDKPSVFMAHYDVVPVNDP